MPNNRPTLREAAVARARFVGFTEAADLITALSGMGLSPAAVAAAMQEESRTLFAAAEDAEAAVAARPAPKPKLAPVPDGA